MLSLQKIRHALLNAGFDIRVESSQPLNVPARKSHHDSNIETGNSGKHEQYCSQCRENPAYSILSSTQTSVYAVELKPHFKDRISTPNQYILTLAIGGMTCASCTRTIAENLANISGVCDVTINLIENYATCKLVSDKLADLVRDTVEDCGYKAQIVGVELEHKNILTEATTLRTVALKVKGISSSSVIWIYCLYIN